MTAKTAVVVRVVLVGGCMLVWAIVLSRVIDTLLEPPRSEFVQTVYWARGGKRFVVAESMLSEGTREPPMETLEGLVIPVPIRLATVLESGTHRFDWRQRGGLGGSDLQWFRRVVTRVNYVEVGLR